MYIYEKFMFYSAAIFKTFYIVFLWTESSSSLVKVVTLTSDINETKHLLIKSLGEVNYYGYLVPLKIMVEK